VRQTELREPERDHLMRDQRHLGESIARRRRRPCVVVGPRTRRSSFASAFLELVIAAKQPFGRGRTTTARRAARWRTRRRLAIARAAHRLRNEYTVRV